MCQGNTLSRWQRICIERMLSDDRVSLELIIRDVPGNYPPRSFGQKVKDAGFRTLLFNMYLRLFYKPASLRRCDMTDLFAAVPVIDCVVEKKGKYSQYFKEADLKVIASYDLDIILRFGFNIIRGAILTLPRYGVWSFHHDDEQRYRGGPPCFWEIYHKDPETGSILQRLTEKLDAGVILKKGIFRTKDYSYAKNIDQAYFESAKWPALVCNDILAGTAGYVEHAPAVTHAPIYKYPGNLQFLRFMLILTANIFKKVWARLFVMQQWNVALVQGNVKGFLANPAAADIKVSLLKHINRRSFNADCFGIKAKDGVRVWFEELDYTTGKTGRIMVSTFSNGNADTVREEVVDLQLHGAHASYPFVFRDGVHLYMIPETGALGEVRLYKAADAAADSGCWEQQAVLLQGSSFADTTLFFHNRKYWLFFTRQDEHYDVDLHLHIAFAEKLEGPYILHPQNPVKISARSARPAGNLFFNEQGELIRPAQNFCKTYGGSVVLNRIDELSETAFRETEIGELLPFDKYYKDGLHTVNLIDERTLLVDMKRHAFRPLINK